MTVKVAVFRLCAAILALAMSVTIALNAAIGQTDYSQDLDQLRSQIKQMEANAAEKEKERKQLQQQLAQIDQELSEAKQERQSALQTLRSEDLSQKDIRRTKYSQLLEFDQLTEAFELTLQAYYQSSKLDNMTVALRDSDINRLQRTRAYLHYLAKNQAVRMQQLQKSLNDDSGDDTVVSHLVHQSSELKQRMGQLKSAERELKNQIAALDNELIENQSELLYLQQIESRSSNQVAAARSSESAQPAEPAPELEFKLAPPIDAPIKRKFGDPKQAYGSKWNGVLYKVKANQEVQSTAAGVVIFAKQHKTLGLLVIIDHGNELFSLYAHNSELRVSLGENVAARQVIAATGETGDVSSPSLYFELRENGDPIDPLQRLEG